MEHCDCRPEDVVKMFSVAQAPFVVHHFTAAVFRYPILVSIGAKLTTEQVHAQDAAGMYVKTCVRRVSTLDVWLLLIVFLGLVIAR